MLFLQLPLVFKSHRFKRAQSDLHESFIVVFILQCTLKMLVKTAGEEREKQTTNYDDDKNETICRGEFI